MTEAKISALAKDSNSGAARPESTVAHVIVNRLGNVVLRGDHMKADLAALFTLLGGIPIVDTGTGATKLINVTNGEVIATEV